MPYPEPFYYAETGSQVHYTSRPSGDIDFDRVIESNPNCFIAGTTAKELKQKKLILADWTVRSWSTKKTGLVCEELQKLIEQGFSLYMWQEGRVIELTKDTINSLNNSFQEVAKKIEVEFPEIIVKTAITQHKLTQDSTFLLDDYWIERLLNPDTINPEPILKTTPFLALDRWEKKLLEDIVKRSPNINTMRFDTLSGHTVLEQEEIERFIASCRLETDWQIDTLRFDQKNMAHHKQAKNGLQDAKRLEFSAAAVGDAPEVLALLNGVDFKHIESLSILGCPKVKNYFCALKPKELINLKELCIRFDTLTSDHINALIQAAPHLEQFEFNGTVTADFSSIQENFQKLKILTFNRSTSAEGLKTLLKIATHLEELHLNHCENITGLFTSLNSDKRDLKTLKVLSLENSDLSHEDMKAVLKLAPNVEELTFKKLKQMEGVLSSLNSNNISLQKLKVLNIDGCTISTEDLRALLDLAPNLETIEIQNAEIKNSTLSSLDWGQKRFEKLSQLSLHTTIPVDSLKALLQAAPGVKHLQINTKDVNGHTCSFLTPENLNTVKQLDLTQNVISADELTVLFQSLSEIEHFFFRDCRSLKGDLTLKPRECPKLKVLDLTSLTIKAQNLVTLLKASPNVEELWLSRDTQIEGSFTHLEPGSLDNLHSLHLSNSPVTLVNITALIKAAPHLNRLGIHNCKNLTGVLSLEVNSLPHLTILNIKGSTITPENLKILLKAAPNLKKIELFKNFTEEELKALKLTYPHIDITDPSIPTSDAPHVPVTYHLSRPGQELRKPNDVPETLDADTAPEPNKKFYANRIFYSLDGSTPPAVTAYRLGVATAFTVNQKSCKPYEAFQIGAEGDPQLKPCKATASQDDLFKLGSKLQKKAGHDCLYGRHRLVLDSNWQAIPSLAAGEELVHYHVHPATDDVEIQYSERDNLYYIKSRSGTPHQVTLDFLLQVPKEKKKLPAALNKVVREFRSFGAKALDIKKANPTGEDYLNYILEQKTGACRHRSFAFMAKMRKEAPEVPVRIVNNASHSFVEIKVNGDWISSDLGGYPGETEITENYIPNQLLDAHKPFVPPPPVIELNHYPKNPYDSALQTWRKKVQIQPDLAVYLQHLVNPSEQKNRLVQLNSEEAIIALTASIQNHCESIQRPLFYLHSPEDIVCASHYLKRDKEMGVITKGPGGALHDFLKAKYHSDNPPILLINYSRFTAADLVRLNTLVDKHRSADGTDLPEEALVVGLINTGKPDCYQGSDFYSRFDRKDDNPLLTETLSDVLIPISDTAVDSIHLNLYHAADWKPRLLGSWRLDQGQLVFHEGLLPKALKKARSEGKALTLDNGLWDDPEFVFFWQQALITGSISYAGGEPLDVRGLTLHKGKGYDWNLLKQQCVITETPNAGAKLLNPSTLSDFFSRYHLSPSKSLISAPGLIEEAVQELEVHVTRSLREDDWARFVTECQKKKIQLKISLAPGVDMPQHLHAAPIPPRPPQALPWNAAIDQNTQLIISSDPDTTVDLLTKGSTQDWIILDVSECHSADLLLYTKPELITTPQPHLEFTQTQRIVLTALKEGKSVLLKGQYSPELADALSALALERQKQGDDASGQLILVSDTIAHLGAIPGHYAHQVTLAEKQTALGAPIRSVDAAKPLSTLKSELHFPNSWDGLKNIEQTIKPLAPFNPKFSATEAAAFNTTRQDQVWKVLKTSPYVYIAGLSGVGKSTFVEKELFKGIKHELYVGETNMETWAKDEDDSTELKILFIDEENLSGRKWSEFEGLFNTPPVILINGVYHKLTPQHKVLFAGNPVSYGDERTLSPFFVRHGRAVVFDPLPLSVIYEQILKPVFNDTALTSKTAEICQPILEVYTFLCSQSLSLRPGFTSYIMLFCTVIL